MSFEVRPFIKNRLKRKVFTGLPLTIFLIVIILLVLTFLGITSSIVDALPIVKLDASFTQFLFNHRTPGLVHIFYSITHLADLTTACILLAICSAYLLFKRELAYLFALLLIFFGNTTSVYFIKIFINRDRPGADIAYYIENSKSFPSGHAAIAIALYGFITYYLMHHVSGKTRKSLLVCLGALVILLVGFSRLYLGVHYISDVIGGFIMGGLWLTIGIAIREEHFYTDSLKKDKTHL